MSTDVFRALLADTISTMSPEELRNIIMNTPNKDLGAVGAAVLAEKGKKAPLSRSVEEVGSTRASEKGKKVKKVTQPAAKKKATSRQTPGKDKGTAGVAGTAPAGSNKRKHDAIDISSDHDEDILEHIGNVANDKFPLHPQGIYTTPGMLNTILKGVRGADRQRLKRMTEIMDQSDWSQVKNRGDLIGHLLEGELSMSEVDSRYDPETVITNKAHMAEFLDRNHLKLEYHPMFATAFHIESSLDSNGPAFPREVGTWGHKDRWPTYDWSAIIEKMSDLTPSSRRSAYGKIARHVCSTSRDIIDHYGSTSSGGNESILELAEDIEGMADCARIVYSASEPKIKEQMLNTLPDLRECLLVLCTAISSYTAPHLSKALATEKRREIRKQLRFVEMVVKGDAVELEFQRVFIQAIDKL